MTRRFYSHDSRIFLFLLGFVPRFLRSKWPFRRHYWQGEELRIAKERAAEYMERVASGEK